MTTSADPNAFVPQSSDEQRSSSTRQNVDVASGYYDTIGQVLGTKSVGFESTFTILDLTDLGLFNSIVDIDVWMQEITSGGGGTNNYNYIKLPFTRYLTGGTVGDAAYINEYYNASVAKGNDTIFTGAALLQVVYRNNVSSTTYPKFYYKVSNRQVLG
jgi:hypothetical protein